MVACSSERVHGFTEGAASTAMSITATILATATTAPCPIAANGPSTTSTPTKREMAGATPATRATKAAENTPEDSRAADIRVVVEVMAAVDITKEQRFSPAG